VLALFAILGGGAAFAAVETDQNLSAWDGVWWAITTVTTVGYGDPAVTTDAGRIIAIGLMFTGIGFVAVLTAAAADRFVRSQRAEEEARAERRATEERAQQQRRAIEERLDQIIARLDAPRTAIAQAQLSAPRARHRSTTRRSRSGAARPAAPGHLAWRGPEPSTSPEKLGLANGNEARPRDSEGTGHHQQGGLAGLAQRRPRREGGRLEGRGGAGRPGISQCSSAAFAAADAAAPKSRIRE
jgi:hypothetical protein